MPYWLSLPCNCCCCREQLADARGDASAAHSALSTLALRHPLSAASLLEACAAAALPAVEEQLGAMASTLAEASRVNEGAAAPALGPGSATEPASRSGEDSESASSPAGSYVAPWDLAYAQQLLVRQCCPLATSGPNLDRLSLRGAMQVGVCTQGDLLSKTQPAGFDFAPRRHLWHAILSVVTVCVQGIGAYLWTSMGIQLDLDSHQSAGGRSQQEGSGTPTLNQHMAESASAAATGFGFGANSAAFGSGATGAAAGRPAELWSETVLTVNLSVPETGARGVLYVDPGGGYGARQLNFSSSNSRRPNAGGAVSQQQAALPIDQPAVSLGLMWRWPGGMADGLPALWELLHELGHGVHLLLSSQRQPHSPTQSDTGIAGSTGRGNAATPDGESDGEIGTRSDFKHFGGLHLPLDILEVPSTFMEKLAMHPATLQVSRRAVWLCYF